MKKLLHGNIIEGGLQGGWPMAHSHGKETIIFCGFSKLRKVKIIPIANDIANALTRRAATLFKVYFFILYLVMNKK